MPSVRVGTIDDPVWREGVPLPQPARPSSPLLATIVTLVSSFVLVITLVAAPWFGLDQNLGRWNLTPTWTAVGDLPRAAGQEDFGPGTRGFGGLLVAMALVTFVLAVVSACSVIRRMYQGRRPSLAFQSALVAAAVSSLVMVIVELGASPPLGAGPNLSFDWGALIGVTAASLSALGAVIAVTITLSGRKRQSP
jgi:hypothetical protein